MMPSRSPLKWVAPKLAMTCMDACQYCKLPGGKCQPSQTSHQAKYQMQLEKRNGNQDALPPRRAFSFPPARRSQTLSSKYMIVSYIPLQDALNYRWVKPLLAHIMEGHSKVHSVLGVGNCFLCHIEYHSYDVACTAGEVGCNSDWPHHQISCNLSRLACPKSGAVRLALARLVEGMAIVSVIPKRMRFPAGQPVKSHISC